MKEIFERVSIRKYEDRPVEEEKIRQILKAAMAAPSAGNQQPWEFYVIRDREKIRQLAEVTPYSKSAAGAPVVIVPCYRTSGLWAPMYDTIDLCVQSVDSILGLGEDLHSFALVPVGYPAESRPQQDRFQEERIHWIG